MNFFDISVIAARVSDTPTLFPFPFKIHLIFSIVAFVFFLWRFAGNKRPYQLIMAVAIPLSLVIWASDNRVLFYSIGIAEAVLLLAALVTSFIFKDEEEKKADSVEYSSEESDNNDPDDNDSDDSDSSDSSEDQE